VAADSQDLVETTVSEVAELEQQERAKRTHVERTAALVTNWTGSIRFIIFNAAFFASWIVLNLPVSPLQFDHFPFNFLTMIVSLEAIFLSIFVLISENAQSRDSDRRARLDTQVNVIAEREVTKILGMLAAVHEHLGLTDEGDQELDAMQHRTPIDHVAQTVEAADQNGGTPDV
jgi:uncharacterized membrane protein